MTRIQKTIQEIEEIQLVQAELAPEPAGLEIEATQLESARAQKLQGLSIALVRREDARQALRDASDDVEARAVQVHHLLDDLRQLHASDAEIEDAYVRAGVS